MTDAGDMISELQSNAIADSAQITAEMTAPADGIPQDEAQVAASQEESKVTLVSLADFSNGKQQTYYLKGLCPRSGIGQIIGESGAAKSFISLDMAYALAIGRNWFRWRYSAKARRNLPLVVYLVLEGAGGFRLRVKAILQREHKNPDNLNPEPVNFVLSDAPFDISDLNARIAMVKSIKAMAGERGVVLFVDTQAQAMPALDENSSEDMGKLIKCVEEIQRDLAKGADAFVWLISHLGKYGDAKKGSRGWSGLKAPMDVQIGVDKPSSGSEIRHFSIVKNKDGAEGEVCSFILQGAVVGVDEDGENLESATVEPCPEMSCSIVLTEDEKKALDALRHAYEKCGVKIGQRIHNADWIKTYQRDMAVDYNTAKNKVNYFGTTLQEKKVLLLDKEGHKKLVRLFEAEEEVNTPWDKAGNDVPVSAENSSDEQCSLEVS